MTTSTYSNADTATTGDKLWQKGFLAAGVATVINLVLWAIGAFMGGLHVQDKIPNFPRKPPGVDRINGQSPGGLRLQVSVVQRGFEPR